MLIKIKFYFLILILNRYNLLLKSFNYIVDKLSILLLILKLLALDKLFLSNFLEEFFESFLQILLSNNCSLKAGSE